MKWLSWSNVVLGFWLIVAPFALGYSSVRSAAGDDVALGLLIAACAMWRAVSPEAPAMRGVSWVVAAAGVWVLVAPMTLGYLGLHVAAGNDMVVGLLVVSFAVIRGTVQTRRTAVQTVRAGGSR